MPRSKVKLTRGQEKQFQAVRANFYITRREFLEFWTDVRKANRKGRRMRNEGALYAPEFSTRLEVVLTSRDVFKERRESVAKVLKRSYRRSASYQIRERFYNNLREIFGTAEGNRLARDFRSMSDAEFSRWLDENEDLKPIVYNSKTSQYAYFIGLTAENIKKRF